MHSTRQTGEAERLRMEGVSKRFGPTVALDGVSLRVQAGEIHALVGENGAGKSTLMKVLSGACRADSGRMWLDGMAYAPRSPLEGRRAGVAMVYQELSLAPHLSVEENLLLGVEPRRGPVIARAEARRRAAEALRLAGRPDIPLDARVGRLPQALRQVVEIARGVTGGCRVLVLDEPTSSLGRDDGRRLFALVRTLAESGVAVVYISHVLEEVRQLAQSFTVLRDGRRSGGGAVADTPLREIVSSMVGRDLEEFYPRSPRVPGEVVLEVRDLHGRRLPRSATLALRRGEVLGLAGLVGAGRSELLRAIFGLDPVRRGSVRVGAFAGPASPLRRWAQGVGIVSEDRAGEGLALRLDVAENLTMPCLSLFGAKGLLSPARQGRCAAGWIERLAIRCRSARQPVAALSGGNQQKVALARLMVAGCDVYLLDEPTRGIDVGSKALLYRLVDDLACGRGAPGAAPAAVLVASSHLPELLGMCDRVAVMRRGSLGPARPIGELSEHAIMLEATGVEERS
jgi:ribose transport system ATP-binding protein